MKFTGQIRVPEVDHPGVPATFLIDDVQVEVILEDESLGRWSLYDVHAQRLVSSAFQVVLAGEEITFIADDPIDFAYAGVEHMAEVWARFKSMNIARRSVAVRRSRRGTQPSRISEIRDAMVGNLEAEHSGLLTEQKPVPQDGITAETVAQEIEALSADHKIIESDEPATEIQMPVVGKTTGDEKDGPDAPPEEAESGEQQHLETERLEDEKRAIEEERASLYAEKQKLELKRLEAEQTEADRIEAFRVEMERLERERLEIAKAEAQRLEQQRAETDSREAEKAAAEKAAAEVAEAARVEQERLDAEAAAKKTAAKKTAAKKTAAEKTAAERAAAERAAAERAAAERAA
ncbi:MAG: hypothetical protein O6853_08520, partial [Actinobacteria bacterium]|nr:hypothetical protein [Actinomycetota bacterium]